MIPDIKKPESNKKDSKFFKLFSTFFKAALIALFIVLIIDILIVAGMFIHTGSLYIALKFLFGFHIFCYRVIKDSIKELIFRTPQKYAYKTMIDRYFNPKRRIINDDKNKWKKIIILLPYPDTDTYLTPYDVISNILRILYMIAMSIKRELVIIGEQTFNIYSPVFLSFISSLFYFLIDFLII